MTTAVRTPLDTTPAVALGNKLWRKQIIRGGKLHYDGQVFDVSDQYLDSVAAAFQDGAIKSVPFTFVAHDGSHSEAPERRKGRIVGVERTTSGMDAICDLDDDADQLVRKDRQFGVSVLIKHDRTTGGGKKYPAVLAHVAGTWDPVINDLDDWQEIPEIAASHDGEDVLDLLALTSRPTAPSAQAAADPTTAPRGDVKETPMAEQATPLTDDEIAGLRSLAAIAPQLVATFGVGESDDEPDEDTSDTTDTDDTDEEVVEATSVDRDLDPGDGDELFSAEDLDEMTRTIEPPAAVAASHNVRGTGDDAPIVGGPSDEVLALTHQLNEEKQARQRDALELSRVTADLDERRYLGTRENLAREFGIHPADTDIIRPLIEGAGVGHVALSHGGKKVDVAATVLKFAKAVASRPRLDLSQAKGHSLDIGDEQDDEAAEKDRTDFLARARAELGD